MIEDFKGCSREQVNMFCSLFAMIVSLLFAGIMIPKILEISFAKRLFDVPNERKIHKSFVPRLGGVAFLPIFFFSLMLTLGLGLRIGLITNANLINGVDFVALFLLACALLLIYVIGLGDDLVSIRYRFKFFVQILAALLVFMSGLKVSNLFGFLGINVLPEWVSFFLSLLLVTFIVNAMNLIDGIDGLCSGLSIVALIYYGALFHEIGEYLYVIVSFSFIGVLLPFFYYNVFGDPEKKKKIFMGDTGSLTLGLLLSILSFNALKSDTTGLNLLGSPHPLIAAFAPLAIPCTDVVRVFFYRLSVNRNPFLPDNNHIHHILMKCGVRKRAAMIIIVFSQLVIILGFNFLSTVVDSFILLLAFLLLYSGISLLLIRIAKVRKVKEGGEN